MSSQWIWSPEHSDYYSATNDQYGTSAYLRHIVQQAGTTLLTVSGQTKYVWATQLQPSAAAVAPSIAQPANNQPETPRIRQDSPQDSQQLLSPSKPILQGDTLVADTDRSHSECSRRPQLHQQICRRWADYTSGPRQQLVIPTIQRTLC